MTYLHRTLRDESGFTVVELLLVIVVLGILAGIVLFGAGTFQRDAKAARDAASDRVCATAKAASQVEYANDTNYVAYLAPRSVCR